jgi:hypothetical protein
VGYCAAGHKQRTVESRMKPLERMTALSKFNVGEAFGVPHTFNPNLSLSQAVLAAGIAFSRIILGSMLFALWGVAGLLTYAAIANPALRILAVVPIILLFLLSLVTLMLGISMFINWLHRRREVKAT